MLGYKPTYGLQILSSKFFNTRRIKNPRGVFLTTCPEMRKVESKLKSANVSTLFTSMDPSSKKRPSDFWKTV